MKQNGPVKAARARNYMFTINFGVAEDGSEPSYEQLTPAIDRWGDRCVRYCRWQLEVGAEGVEHIQGYLELSEPQSMTWVHRNLPGMARASLQTRKGSASQADAYCSKDDTRVDGPWTFGVRRCMLCLRKLTAFKTISKQGQSSALLASKALLDTGSSLKRVAEDHFEIFLRHEKGLKSYKRMITKPRDFKTVVFLFVGPPGRGKSTLMTLLAAKLGTVYRAPQAKGSGCYFDDYDGQDVFILDEFDGASMQPTMFNTIADRFECVLPVHGGAGHQMVSKVLFVGSNYIPKYWWRKRNASQLLQTTRRIDVYVKVGFTYVDQAPMPAAGPHCLAGIFENLYFGAKILNTQFPEHREAPQARLEYREAAQPPIMNGPTLNGSMSAYVESMRMNGIMF